MRLCKRLLIIVLLGLMSVGCTDTGSEDGSFIPTGNIIAVAVRGGSDQTIKVGGTPGAVPPGSLVEVTDLNTGMTENAIGGPDGSFDPTFLGNTNDVFNVLVTQDGEIVENIDIGVTLLSDAVTRDIANLGSVPDDIIIRNNRAYVINGFSNNIQVFDLEQDPPQEIGTPIVLPPGSNPTGMAFLNDTIAYVANNIGQSVAVVNVQTGECELIIVRTGEGNSFPPCQEVRFAVSAFEDPADIAIANGKVYVSNNNLNDFFEPAGPGFISIINAQNNQFIGTRNTSGANSSGLTIIGNDLYVVNAGDISSTPDFSEFFCDFKFPPSIDVIDTQIDDIIDTIDIPLSEENAKVCLPNKIEPTPDERFGYIGLGIVGAMFKVDFENNTIINGPSNPIRVTDLTSLNTIGDIKINEDGVGFVSVFENDQIAVFDTSNDEVNPFPFVDFFPAGIRADNPNSDFFDGVQSLAIRPGVPGIDFEGADIFYITGISMKLGSVNTALVLPPE